MTQSPNQINEQVQVSVIDTSGAQAAATSNIGAPELQIVVTSAPLIVQIGDPILVTKP